ncbi:hypothetical protein A2334_01750 [Candidatus Roizmanbacteria bacterium RIFOXYB2_FULL_38_10]|uniref:Uncharacterized protein n=1 Tax=Candidatus Roizmanbacteria bacterium RIFOXYD1_FULL_38_12 TaxID=1802093 RepID=A0A1F7L1R8_9BACT|nr:MAG: hypothetical protein A3K47_04810 [Candidatus Roizmanbacteria bacterium RIFOXYA2_FULL_38_14]OGK64070.1 MAG: hypothetical protein A3K27_04810 [Candidatus Roizmanbacteria bacterium RIFOXYA1_FULL_37_12]OGK65916.1 MAG: hypothetical protein A3K38_04810 [Candidatus Roizmanbacteria bacterium RIFOXYB1_FULL_40_23]OGK68069.1 MAG: hypothetical protein A2334_01750 [Candidatus Roizmanbacteria bacterium RIFOXYB2_FULL_38_10]OGK70321.1 MAG: hypothetical protein A3K21_04815 [Candidatus Roizmanbacteria ba
MKKLYNVACLLLIATLISACFGSPVSTPEPQPSVPTNESTPQPQPTAIPSTPQPPAPSITPECHPPMICSSPEYALSTVVEKRELTMERSPYKVEYTNACIDAGWLYDVTIIIYVDERPTQNNVGEWEITLTGEVYHQGDQYLVSGCNDEDEMSVGFISFESGKAYLNLYDWWARVK